MRTTKEDRERWARLAEEATPGPWTLEGGPPLGWNVAAAHVTVRICEGTDSESDARLIAASRDAVPALLADLAAAESERDAAREALRQVAEQAHATAVCYLEYGMEEIRRYSAANDLTEIRDAARAALAGKGGNTNG